MEENLEYWIALNLALAENLGEARKLVRKYPRITDLFGSGRTNLACLGVDDATVKSLFSPGTLEKASEEIEWCKKNGVEILTSESEKYPALLREIFDPPFVLFVAGRIEALEEPCLSIVGARKATPYGRAVARKLARDLAERGLVIVSGMARGIDSCAHWGALEKGRTIAVLGSGLDWIYPRENSKLYRRIIDEGAVVTEYAHAVHPASFHFPLRNRIITGLSSAVVVVEATKRSGSLISARLAVEQNREVMAVPGNVTSAHSQGTNWLIRSGAVLVEDWEDVLEELPIPVRDKLVDVKEENREYPPDLDGQEKKIFELLRSDSMAHVDELVEKSDLSVSEVLSILLKLELKGIVCQGAGKNYQRKL